MGEDNEDWQNQEGWGEEGQVEDGSTITIQTAKSLFGMGSSSAFTGSVGSIGLPMGISIHKLWASGNTLEILDFLLLLLVRL